MHGLRIVGLAVVAAIGYGIVHDQVTAHLCVEYFTIGHPPVFPTQSPTLLGLGWGIIATWWVGVPLGLLLSAAARLSARPKLTEAQLRRPLGVLLLVMAACAVMAGVVGGTLAALGRISLAPPLAAIVPADHHVAFLVDLWMHSASYAAGILGGLVLVGWTWRQRARSAAAAA